MDEFLCENFFCIFCGWRWCPVTWTWLHNKDLSGAADKLPVPVNGGDVQWHGLGHYVTMQLPGAGAQLPVPVDGGGVQWHGLGP
jgi:hypothetical protein